MNSELDSYIAGSKIQLFYYNIPVSFVGDTRVLKIEEEEIVDCDFSGFDHNVQSLFCGAVRGCRRYLQVRVGATI